MPGVRHPRTWTNFHAAWAKDYLDREHLIPGGAKVDAYAFPADNAVTVTTATTIAAVGATSITVAALSGPIPANTAIRFNNGVQAFITTTAATGATTLTVDPLQGAVPIGSVAQYRGTGRRILASGTIIGRTTAEAEAGTPFGPAIDTDDQIFLVAFEKTDLENDNDVDLYRPGSIVATNHLPSWAGAAAALRTKLRTIYITTTGAD
jgi:hypothetical protein